MHIGGDDVAITGVASSSSCIAKEEPEQRLLATKDEYIVARSVGKYEEGTMGKRAKRGTPMGIETASSSSAREIVPMLDEEGDEDF